MANENDPFEKRMRELQGDLRAVEEKAEVLRKESPEMEAQIDELIKSFGKGVKASPFPPAQQTIRVDTNPGTLNSNKSGNR